MKILKGADRSQVLWTVSKLIENVEDGTVNFNIDIQRGYVWKNNDKRSALIRTLILDKPIPPILWGSDKMKCPYCGSEEGYYEIEKVHRALLYTFDGEPDGCSEDYNEWTSKRKYCRACHRILPRKMFDDN